MSKYNIDTEKDKAYRDKRVLERLYWDENLTQKQMASVLDADPSTIWRWMDKHGVETKDNSEAQVAHERLLDRDWLVERYIGEMLSITEISEILGVSRMPVYRALERHDIETHSKGYKVKKNHAGLSHHDEGYEIWHSRHTDNDGKVKQRFLRVHRLLAVSEFGFESVSGVEVHHKNGIPWDNRPENIELLSKEDHAKHHFNERGGIQPWQG